MIRILFFLFLANVCVDAQTDEFLKNEIRFQILRIDLNQETINDLYVTKFMHGLAYKRYLNKHISPIIGIELNYRKINERKPSYNFAYEGKGTFFEQRIYGGVGFVFPIFQNCFATMETIAYWATSQYEGSFTSNQSGHRVTLDNSFRKRGAVLKAGVAYLLTDYLRINAAFGSVAEEPNLREETKTDFISNLNTRTFSWVPLELTFSILI